MADPAFGGSESDDEEIGGASAARNWNSGGGAAKDWQRPGGMSRTKSRVSGTTVAELATYVRDEELEVLGWRESQIFAGLTMGFQLFLIILYAIWADYLPDPEAEENVDLYYSYFRDVLVMILFGFGFLMTFLRRFGFGAVGYTMLLTVLAAQWSIMLGFFFDEIFHEGDFDSRKPITIVSLLDSLFCTAAVLISYGAVLGKATPLQLFIMAVVEPIFFWINFYCCALELEAVDVGGGFFIHMLGAYFGLAVCWFLTSSETHGHPDNTSCYSSDLLSLAGTIFLWIMWPSFNAAVAAPGIERLRAIVNTFLSLCGATCATFIFSRLFSESKGRFDVVHVQNATLAGGVAMGIAAHLNVTPAGAIGSGFLAGVISTIGYIYLTPVISRRLGIQDICGVHNLHGLPSILAAIVSIVVTASVDSDELPRGTDQPLIQLATLGITLGLAIAGGTLTGALMRFTTPQHISRLDFFNDRQFWGLPSDYEHVIRSD